MSTSLLIQDNLINNMNDYEFINHFKEKIQSDELIFNEIIDFLKLENSQEKENKIENKKVDQKKLRKEIIIKENEEKQEIKSMHYNSNIKKENNLNNLNNLNNKIEKNNNKIEEEKNDEIKKEEKKEIEQDDEEEEEEEQEDNEKEEDEKEEKSNDEIINNYQTILTNSIKKAEKEIEEAYDRISYLKEKLIESKKGQSCSSVKLSEKEINIVLDNVYPILKNEPSMLELEPPIYICGDIHGQFYDLLRVFDILKYPPESKFLFLGDYVDRGKKSLECILLLLCLKIKYPSNIYLLRGNHECEEINRAYGFFDECKRKVSIKIYKQFCNLFNILPITALIGDKILCMHGGLSYELKDISQLKKIVRPTEIPDSGLLCDLVWSDPDDSLFLDFCKNNERGISICFSQTVVENFTKNNDIDLICRAHQVVEEGFQFFANMKLITVFTAPNYMGEFDNKGGILKVNENMVCSLHILNPAYNKKDYSKMSKIDRPINKD